MARLVHDWELASSRPPRRGRVVQLRIGVVLDRTKGHSEIADAVQAGVWRPLSDRVAGDGWVHHADLTGLILLAIDHSDAKGPLMARHLIRLKQLRVFEGSWPSPAPSGCVPAPASSPVPAFLARRGSIGRGREPAPCPPRGPLAWDTSSSIRELTALAADPGLVGE